jgi:hypothetical protein
LCRSPQSPRVDDRDLRVRSVVATDRGDPWGDRELKGSVAWLQRRENARCESGRVDPEIPGHVCLERRVNPIRLCSNDARPPDRNPMSAAIHFEHVDRLV